MSSSPSIAVVAKMQSSGASRFPRIREAFFDDYSQIVTLCKRYLGKEPTSFQQWQHPWINNPVYASLGKKWPIGWIIESSGEIVGYIGNIPFLFELERKKILAAIGCDWVVDASYRGYASLMADHFLNQEAAELVLSTTANEHSNPVFTSLGASRVPVGQWDCIASWITDYPGFAAKWMRARGVRGAPLVSYFIASALFLKDTIRGRSLEPRSRSFEVRSCTDFDDRFDVFWEELKQQSHGVLLAMRTREALDWHFKRSLVENRVWIAIITNNGRITAYGIFVCKHDLRSGMKRALFVDFQNVDDRADALVAILHWSLEKCRKEGVHKLENIGLRLGQSDISRLAPYIRKRSSWSYLYKARDRGLATTLADPRVWEPSGFEVDTTI